MPSKKKTAAPSKAEQEKKRQKKPEEHILHILMPYLLWIVALFLALSLLLGSEKLGLLGYISVFLKGFFSLGAWFVPVCLGIHAVFYKRDLAAGSHLYKFWFSFAVVTMIGVMMAIFCPTETFTFNFVENFTAGKNLIGGGAVGGLVFACLKKCVGLFTPVLAVLFLIVFSCLLFGKTPGEVVRSVFLPFTERLSAQHEERRERRKEAKLQREAQDEENGKAVSKLGKKEKCPVNMETGEEVTEQARVDLIADDEIDIRLPLSEEEARRAAELQAEEEAAAREIRPIEEIESEPVPDLHAQIRELFSDVPDASVKLPSEELIPDLTETEREIRLNIEEKHPEDLETESVLIETEEEVPEEPSYQFPPVSLLPMPAGSSSTSRAEQESTAKKLVETLASFGVKTSVSGIAKGPAVTRYEIQPQPGVRVRSIVNLTDDIALALAAGGVRIEAPIPGKEAVGIEVPNRARDIVYIRELIEREEFSSHTSRLYTCLGKDVAGNAVFCDLAKMPHILIAGATGMGKSVCLNSMIVSILYHASPDEVQMILIDPKKVEMGKYNGIPHLLVPVVSDSKKAAGSLAWAVIEMEKRFVQMEELGVRDIKSYNEITKNDPEKQPMTHIVIIIDELADLMMTARDEVETSICRLAQKARAAGMHLVIGTQRPSVDVITGLIKANVPSRIACTVASQVDSRTIIDIQGAEKLLGKGDMLYAPVGLAKPMRVQGCFVDEKEIEEICQFIRRQRCANYDEAVSNQIEVEAAKCGEKKRGAFFAATEDSQSVGSVGIFSDKDPLLEKAIDVAITEKRVSTSLLQRKLSVGYARAAKLIDYMAELNIVGPYAGSKPREVLWTREYFNEYKMRALEDAPIQ